jgi:hypothetical protein
MTVDVIAAARRRTRRLVIAFLGVCGGLALLIYPAGLYVDAHLRPSTPMVSASVGPTGSGSASLTPPSRGILPANTMWMQLAGVNLPRSSATGPHDLSDGLARGFAHTTAGAVVAALHLLVRTTPEVGPTIFEPTLQNQVVGADADSMLEAVEADYQQTALRIGVPYGQPLGDLPAHPIGVQVVNHSTDRLDVSLLTSASDTAGVNRFAACEFSLVWSAGDWRLVAPSGGRWDADIHVVDNGDIGRWSPIRAG